MTINERLRNSWGTHEPPSLFQNGTQKQPSLKQLADAANGVDAPETEETLP